MAELIAYKSNALIEASYKLTLQEQRFLLACIGRLNSKDAPDSQKSMTLTAAEFYTHFPDMGRKQRRAEYLKGEGKVEITFSDAIMPYLTQLKGQFTKVVVKNISSLSSSHSIRIYELLQQFITTGDRMIRLDDFRSMLNLNDKYPLFKDLNKHVIKPALEELNNKSDLFVIIDTVKQGRKVTSLHFRFKEDKQIKIPEL